VGKKLSHYKPAVRSLKTCILSTHPFFLSELKLITPGTQARHSRQRASSRASELSPANLPKAAVYVIDGQQCNVTMETVAFIRQHRPKAHLLVVGENFDDEIAFALLQRGVRGLLTYSAARKQLSRAIGAVAGGDYWMPRSLLSNVVESMLKAPPKSTRSNSLLKTASRREKQILEHVLDNCSNKEIASHLNISERTVKFHVSNLLAKSGVQRRTELILLALQNQSVSARALQHSERRDFTAA